MDQSALLSVLSRAPAEAVKTFAEGLIPLLGPIEVLRNRTGLVMLPMNDTVKGTTFYLGEILIVEAHVRIAPELGPAPTTAEGYAACLGRDLQQALAIALIDAARTADVARERITAFASAQATELALADERLARQVEATRVELETF